MKQYDVVIIGAGAAGMMCAIEAGLRGRRVLIIDHAKKAGDKIRISGGGRCNFTNLGIKRDCFLSQNPHFAISALKRYTQHDFVAMVERHNIAYHEKTLGQLFCDASSQSIIQMLLDEMNAAGVTLRLETRVQKISYDHVYQIELDDEHVTSESLVIATGGKSIPKMGATGFGYQIAEQFGLPIIETRPALVPLTFSEKDLAIFKPLSGISVNSRVRCDRTSFDEGMLFTHRGLSGPSILQISSYWREGQNIEIDMAARANITAQLKDMRKNHGKQSLQNVLAKLIPSKLAQVIIEQSGFSGNLADQSNQKLEALGDHVQSWQVQPVGTEGYRTAEVTLGGVDTSALTPKTMEAKAQKGLYFIGEVVDVTGWLGGYNFQWAWSSGWVCGQVC